MGCSTAATAAAIRPRTGVIAAVVLFSAALCFGQPSSTVSLSNGIELRVSANLGNPTGEEALKVDLAAASGSSFYRIFWDQNKVAVFAYELKVGRAAGSSMRLTAEPATTEFAARYAGVDGGKPVPTLSAPHEFPTLHSGERSEIGLFEIPGMGLHVSDSVEIKMNADAPANDDGSPPAGAMRLRFSGLKVSVDGQTVSSTDAGSSVTGRYAMFYIPGRGGYFFSTEPSTSRTFVKAGSIDHEKMHFELNNQMFDCTASAPILSGADTGEVWVYYDPAYQPAGNWTTDLHSDRPSDNGADEFFAAASDSLSWWLR